MASRTVTMDFREEYEAERTRWLRTRFLWYSGVLAAFFAVTFAAGSIGVAVGVVEVPSTKRVLIEAARSMPLVIVFVIAFLYVLRRPLTRGQLLWLVFWLTVFTGTLAIAATAVVAHLNTADGNSADDAAARLFGVHFIACLFIPWTPREAVRPFIPLLVVLAITTLLLGTGSMSARFLSVALSPLIALPGIGVCFWRHSRFRDRFHYRMLRGRYGEMRRELLDARVVHEELFPGEITTGPIRFHYCYEPMREIGGDYLYACTGPPSDQPDAAARLNIVLLDVTGHGLKAALTVNRIYGELERLFAEQPDITPGAVLKSLNRYVVLTLAKHSIYATALALRFDLNRNAVEWASAGHPPAFQITAANTVERLDSTAPLLGVFRGKEFQPGQEERDFRIGDTIIAYTDGVIDTADQSGQRLQIDGIQKIIATRTPDADDRGRWCGMLLREIEDHRFGAAVDDTLIVEVFRPIEEGG